jgi:hypothetical protein
LLLGFDTEARMSKRSEKYTSMEEEEVRRSSVAAFGFDDCLRRCSDAPEVQARENTNLGNEEKADREHMENG